MGSLLESIYLILIKRRCRDKKKKKTKKKKKETRHKDIPACRWSWDPAQHKFARSCSFFTDVYSAEFSLNLNSCPRIST